MYARWIVRSTRARKLLIVSLRLSCNGHLRKACKYTQIFRLRRFFTCRLKSRLIFLISSYFLCNMVDFGRFSLLLWGPSFVSCRFKKEPFHFSERYETTRTANHLILFTFAGWVRLLYGTGDRYGLLLIHILLHCQRHDTAPSLQYYSWHHFLFRKFNGHTAYTESAIFTGTPQNTLSS